MTGHKEPLILNYCEFEKDSVLPGYIEGFPHINESTKGYKRYGDQHASLFANVDG